MLWLLKIFHCLLKILVFYFSSIWSCQLPNLISCFFIPNYKLSKILWAILWKTYFSNILFASNKYLNSISQTLWRPSCLVGHPEPSPSGCQSLPNSWLLSLGFCLAPFLQCSEWLTAAGLSVNVTVSKQSKLLQQFCLCHLENFTCFHEEIICFIFCYVPEH